MTDKYSIVAMMMLVATMAVAAGAETLLSDNFDLLGSFKEANLNDYTTNPDRQTGTLANLTWDSKYDPPGSGNYIFILDNQLNMYGYDQNPGVNRATLDQNFNTYTDITFSVDVQDTSNEGYERYAGLALGPIWATQSPNWPTIQLADGSGIVYCRPGDGSTVHQVSVTPNAMHNFKIRLYDDGTGNMVVDMFVNGSQVGTSGMDAGDNVADVYCTLFGDHSYNQYGTILFDNMLITAVITGPETCADAISQGFGMITDLNNDCYVEWADFGIFAADWQKCVDPTNTSCDHPWE